MSIKPTFSGEVQFRRYSDTSTQGVQVTLALHGREALEPLIGKAGKRFMAVLVEIGDDEAPVQPQPRKDTRGPLCKEACDLCAMPEFQKWAHKTADYRGEASEASAKDAILSWCAIDSRKELDTNLHAGGEFVARIRGPFMRYMRERST